MMINGLEISTCSPFRLVGRNKDDIRSEEIFYGHSGNWQTQMQISQWTINSTSEPNDFFVFIKRSQINTE